MRSSARALGHWCVIKDGVIENWQAVVPSTWNASPRDTKGQLGAYEAALLGTPVAVADQPLEILRTIHSFDPCLACATHVMSTSGEELLQSSSPLIRRFYENLEMGIQH